MYQVTAEQKVELKALFAIADARPVSQLGAWKEVYEFITEQEYVPPVDGVGGGALKMFLLMELIIMSDLAWRQTQNFIYYKPSASLRPAHSQAKGLSAPDGVW